MRKKLSVLRALRHAVFSASRQGRAAEVAGWSNAAAALAAGGGVYLASRSWLAAIGALVVTFALLRLALAHRITVWIAAVFGTIAIGVMGGGLAWLFAHVIELAAAPPIAAAVGALVSSALPVWAYSRLAQRRANDVRDSLIDPISVPSSR